MLLATAAKDIVPSIPGEEQGEIYIAGIKPEERVAILHLHFPLCNAKLQINWSLETSRTFASPLHWGSQAGVREAFRR